MSRHESWRDGEAKIISVTPVSRGVLRPCLVTLVTFALIVEGAARYSIIHRAQDLLFILLVLPVAVVSITRTWRWRSHKIHVTNQRVVIEGGAMRHWRTVIDMRDVYATRVNQRVSERLTRRGFVTLDTAAGPVGVGLVRHPNALARLIDAERAAPPMSSVPLDTVFTYDEPEQRHLEVRVDEWQRRRYD
jgi:membrane protein YdbS with pleckstrin-like domain